MSMDGLVILLIGSLMSSPLILKINWTLSLLPASRMPLSKLLPRSQQRVLTLLRSQTSPSTSISPQLPSLLSFKAMPVWALMEPSSPMEPTKDLPSQLITPSLKSITMTKTPPKSLLVSTHWPLLYGRCRFKASLWPWSPMILFLLAAHWLLTRHPFIFCSPIWPNSMEKASLLSSIALFPTGLGPRLRLRMAMWLSLVMVSVSCMLWIRLLMNINMCSLCKENLFGRWTPLLLMPSMRSPSTWLKPLLRTWLWPIPLLETLIMLYLKTNSTLFWPWLLPTSTNNWLKIPCLCLSSLTPRLLSLHFISMMGILSSLLLPNSHLLASELRPKLRKEGRRSIRDWEKKVMIFLDLLRDYFGENERSWLVFFFFCKKNKSKWF